MMGCFFGCDAEAPLVVGGEARLAVLDDDLPAYVVTSDAPEIARFAQDEPGDGVLVAAGRAPGLARAVLRDVATGELIDELPIRVRHATDVSVAGSTGGDTRTVMAGAELDLVFEIACDGERMVGLGALEYEVPSFLDASGGEPLPDELDSLDFIFGPETDERLHLVAREPGLGEVRAVAAGGASAVVPLHVAAPAEVTRVDVAVDEPPSGEGEQVAWVRARAFVGDREVSGPRCEWSLAGEGGPFVFAGEGGTTAGVRAEGAGTAVVTCRVGAADGAVSVRF